MMVKYPSQKFCTILFVVMTITLVAALIYGVITPPPRSVEIDISLQFAGKAIELTDLPGTVHIRWYDPDKSQEKDLAEAHFVWNAPLPAKNFIPLEVKNGRVDLGFYSKRLIVVDAYLFPTAIAIEEGRYDFAIHSPILDALSVGKQSKAVTFKILGAESQPPSELRYLIEEAK